MHWALIVLLFFSYSHSQGPDKRIVLQTFSKREMCTNQIVPTLRQWTFDLQSGHYWDGTRLRALPPAAASGTYTVKCVPMKDT